MWDFEVLRFNPSIVPHLRDRIRRQIRMHMEPGGDCWFFVENLGPPLPQMQHRQRAPRVSASPYESAHRLGVPLGSCWEAGWNAERACWRRRPRPWVAKRILPILRPSRSRHQVRSLSCGTQSAKYRNRRMSYRSACAFRDQQNRRSRDSRNTVHEIRLIRCA